MTRRTSNPGRMGLRSRRSLLGLYRPLYGQIEEEHPVLQVVSKDISRAAGYNEKDPTHKCARLRLTDGSGDVVAVQLCTNAAHLAKRTKKGDLVQLDLFTPCHYSLNKDTDMMPIIFVQQFSHVEYKSVRPDLKGPISVAKGEDEQGSIEKGIEDDAGIPVNEEEIECNAKTQLCSLYGVKFKACICGLMPPGEVDLEEVVEDCHFATKPLSKMENHHKRFVLYWYYATNVYSITGKGNRKHLPMCLVRAIRGEYPELDGNYTGYKGCPQHYVEVPDSGKGTKRRLS